MALAHWDFIPVILIDLEKMSVSVGQRGENENNWSPLQGDFRQIVTGLQTRQENPYSYKERQGRPSKGQSQGTAN